MGRNKTMRMASMRESRDSDLFLVNTQVQSHALLRQEFGTLVPFIWSSKNPATVCSNLVVAMEIGARGVRVSNVKLMADMKPIVAPTHTWHKSVSLPRG